MVDSNFMPAYCRRRAYAQFARQLPGIDTTRGLFRAAFAIALHEHPSARLDEAESLLDQLALTVLRRVRSDQPQAKLAHLHDVLFDLVGLRGNVDDYYNPANSYLHEVLQSRRGLPITLTLIYKRVAEDVGLDVHGINAPGHFLAQVHCPETAGLDASGARWMYVDPFYSGDLLDEDEVYQRIAETSGRAVQRSPHLLARATHRQWLARMLVNLQAVFAATGRERDLFAMQELQDLVAS